MNSNLAARRRLLDRLMVFLCGLACVIVLLPLASLITYIVIQGWGRLDWAFITHLPVPVGTPGGGMANAIVGSLTILFIASVIGIPCGVLSGIYMAEFGKESRFAFLVRFTSNVLSGVPSIVTGIVTYAWAVRTLGHFSGLAGGLALSFMMVPIMARTTEELIKLVPNSVRESALALGVPRWKVILSVVVRTAWSGILTGILLSIARVGGETAPLLFTAFNNQFWSSALQPTASLTVQVYSYAISPFNEWHAQAWSGALVLLILVITINLIARTIFKRAKYIRA